MEPNGLFHFLQESQEDGAEPRKNAKGSIAMGPCIQRSTRPSHVGDFGLELQIPIIKSPVNSYSGKPHRKTNSDGNLLPKVLKGA